MYQMQCAWKTSSASAKMVELGEVGSRTRWLASVPSYRKALSWQWVEQFSPLFE